MSGEALSEATLVALRELVAEFFAPLQKTLGEVVQRLDAIESDLQQRTAVMEKATRWQEHCESRWDALDKKERLAAEEAVIQHRVDEAVALAVAEARAEERSKAVEESLAYMRDEGRELGPDTEMHMRSTLIPARPRAPVEAVDADVDTEEPDPIHAPAPPPGGAVLALSLSRAIDAGVEGATWPRVKLMGGALLLAFGVSAGTVYSYLGWGGEAAPVAAQMAPAPEPGPSPTPIPGPPSFDP